MATIQQYLRSIGVKTPYSSQDDLTEAQIGEKNKANPLSGYGFTSAQEREGTRQQQQMQQQALDKYNQDRMQQMVAQMSSQRAIGHYAGQGVMGLVGKIRGDDKQAPEAPAQNDPELDRFNELAAEVGPDQAKIILGNELLQSGNQAGAAMIQDGKAGLQKAEKDTLELENKTLGNENLKGQIADRKAKGNPTITVQRTGEDGLPMQASLEVIGRDPETGLNIYKELGEAVKGSVTDTNEGFANTKSGVDKRTYEFENSVAKTGMAYDSIDRITKLIDENPNITGWSGRLVAKADDLLSGIRGLSSVLGVTDASMSLDKYNFSSLEKTAQGSEKMRATVLELAAARAAALEPGGRFTEGDIQRQIDAIGGGIANPRTAKALLEQSKEMMLSSIENQGRSFKVNGVPVGSKYEQDIARLRRRVPGGASASNEWEDLGNGVRRRVKK